MNAEANKAVEIFKDCFLIAWENAARVQHTSEKIVTVMLVAALKRCSKALSMPYLSFS